MSNVPIELAYDVKEPIGGANESLAPIFFLHCVATSKEYWFDVPQIVANRTKRRVFNLDARNHGDSEWSEFFNYDVNAEDLINFMDSKSISKAVLIGHCMGGVTAIKVALSHPEKVEMAIIEDMYVKVMPKETQQNVRDFFTIIEESIAQVPTDLNESTANVFVQGLLVGNEAIANSNGRCKRRTSSKKYVAMKRGDDGRYTMKANMRVLIDTHSTEKTVMSENKGVYEGPAYFIYGTESAFKVGDELDHIRQHFPNARFIPIEGLNHAVRLHVPEEFTDVVVKCVLEGNAKMTTK